MDNVCEVIIYTTQSALSFNIIATTEDFQERLTAALENGTAVLDTVAGSKLILNAINVIAIEVHEQTAASVEDLTRDTPPVK